MLLEGSVGPQPSASGSHQPVRLGNQAEVVVQDSHARYCEAAYRSGGIGLGGLYTAGTAAAGVAPGTALGTTPPIALWNPPNSGTVLIVTAASLGYLSGTLGAGTIVLAFAQQNTAPTGGSSLTAQNNYLGGRSGAGKAFQGSTISAAATMLRPVFTLGAALATTPTFPVNCREELQGEFAVPPGQLLCLQGIAAAGTTPLLLFGLTWEEVPLIT